MNASATLLEHAIKINVSIISINMFLGQLNETLKLSAPYVRGLNIRQLLPPVKETLIKDDDASDA